MNKKIFIAIVAILVMASCGGKSGNQQSGDVNTLSEAVVGQTNATLETPPSTPPRTNPGETLYIGTINKKYENKGYEYKGVDVLKISFEKFTVSFVLSENKDKVRDVKVDVDGLKFIVGRNGTGQQADFTTSVGFGERVWDISFKGKNSIDFPDNGVGSKPGMVLLFDGDTATAGIYYEYMFTWDNIQIPIVLGNHNIIFTAQPM